MSTMALTAFVTTPALYDVRLCHGIGFVGGRARATVMTSDVFTDLLYGSSLHVSAATDDATLVSGYWIDHVSRHDGSCAKIPIWNKAESFTLSGPRTLEAFDIMRDEMSQNLEVSLEGFADAIDTEDYTELTPE